MPLVSSESHIMGGGGGGGGVHRGVDCYCHSKRNIREGSEIRFFQSQELQILSQSNLTIFFSASKVPRALSVKHHARWCLRRPRQINSCEALRPRHQGTCTNPPTLLYILRTCLAVALSHNNTTTQQHNNNTTTPISTKLRSGGCRPRGRRSHAWVDGCGIRAL